MDKELNVSNDTNKLFDRAQFLLDKNLVPAGIKKIEDVVQFTHLGSVVNKTEGTE